MREFDKHIFYMKEALKLASEALSSREVPVGAIVVYDNEIIGKGHNMKESSNDPTAHAEIIAIQAASRHLGRSDLSRASIYVTVEPCPMCAGAILLSRISNLFYGTLNPTLGSIDTNIKISQIPNIGSYPVVIGGVLADECQSILENFFSDLRRGG